MLQKTSIKSMSYEKSKKILSSVLSIILMMFIYGTANAAVAETQAATSAMQTGTNVNSKSDDEIQTNGAKSLGDKPLARTIMANPPHFCPEEKNLKKNGLWWSTMDGNWRCYSQSFAKSIDSFVGAQWVGVKIGKIICMYRGKSGMDFPIAMEQVHPEEVLESSGVNWSALVHGYRFCKSTNAADCPFYVKPKTTKEQLYEQIKYVGGTKNNNNNDNNDY